MKILYVEDEIAHVVLAQRTLEENIQQRFELIHAETMADALRLLDADPDIDLVLSDLRLPDGTGLDLLKQVRGRKSAPAVVLVTGQGDQEVAVAASRPERRIISSNKAITCIVCQSLSAMPSRKTVCRASRKRYARLRSNTNHSS